MDARRICSSAVIVAVLAILPGLGPAPASAQESQPRPGREQPQRRQRGHGEHGRWSAAEHPGGSWLVRLPGASVLRPASEDEGPLSDEEREQLTEFLRLRAPRVHRWLTELRARNPAAFEQKLQQAAPRLRQLRRIFDRNPELGENLLRYSENLQRIGRARRAWYERTDPRERERIRDGVRQMLAQNVRIEAAVLEDEADELEQQRDERVEAALARLTATDADLAGEPEELRQLVAQWQAAADEQQRAALTDELRRVCGAQIDEEISRLRERAAARRANAVEEVDRRMERWSSPIDAGPPGFGPERGRSPHHGREQDEQP